MTNLSDAKAALEREAVRVATNGFFRIPRADGYVVIEANYSGIADFAYALVDMLQNWSVGEHQHFEYMDSESNPPVVIMMMDE